MEEIQRVQLKKIYIWRATLFGLLYGLVSGVVLAVVSNLLIFFGFKNMHILGQNIVNVTVGLIAVVTVLLILIFAIIGAIVFLLGSLVYNIVSKFGSKIHLEFMDYEPVKEIAVKEKESKRVNEETAEID